MKQTRACIIKISGKEGRRNPGIVRELRKVNLLFCFPVSHRNACGNDDFIVHGYLKQLYNTYRQVFTSTHRVLLETVGLKLDKTDRDYPSSLLTRQTLLPGWADGDRLTAVALWKQRPSIL